MGWTQYPGHSDRKSFIEDLTRNEDNHRCLAHCYKGAPFQGVLYTVWERENTRGETYRYIVVFLLSLWNVRGLKGWAYKDIETSMHPYNYSCPLKYLKMAPANQEDKHWMDWERGVRAWWWAGKFGARGFARNSIACAWAHMKDCVDGAKQCA